MQRSVTLAFEILALGIMAAPVTSRAQVYAQGIYATGTTYYSVCSLTLPFPPFQYELTERCWREGRNGLTNINIEREPGDIARESLEVRCGSEAFALPLDSVSGVPAKSEDGIPISRDSGDVTPMLKQWATNYGGRTTTNALPFVMASWYNQARTNADIVILEGDHFTEVQNLLEQAYGKPDEAIHSDVGVNARSITYTPAQIGIGLNLTCTWDGKTIISFLGKQRP